MKIEPVIPFVVDGIKYSYSVDGVFFADSFVAAQKGYLALRSLPDEFATTLKIGAKEKGLLLLFDSNREVMRGVAGTWIFATGHLPETSPDIRQFLRNGVIKIPGRQGNKVFDGAMINIPSAQYSQPVCVSGNETKIQSHREVKLGHNFFSL